LAAWLGCGFLAGLAVIRWYPQPRRAMVAGQALLLACILLTQTRAVIAALAILSLVLAWKVMRSRRAVALAGTASLLLALSFVPLFRLPGTQVNDSHYLDQSLTYRVHLESAALVLTHSMPVVGYGPGNLASILACATFQAPDLRHTCEQGFYFDSSHNIFLDRLLELGWVGGGLFLAVTLWALAKGFAARDEAAHVAAAALVLIAVYYLTNVNSIELELLQFVLIVYLSRLPMRRRRRLPAAATLTPGLAALVAIVLVAETTVWAVNSRSPVRSLGPLTLVNQHHPLSPLTYRPTGLIAPAVPVTGDPPAEQRLLAPPAAHALEQMAAAAKQAGITVMLTSGYRSFTSQEEWFENQTYTTGAGADQIIAPPGYSEHQTGLAADLATVSTSGICVVGPCGEYKNQADAWLQANSYRFGFILRYPKDGQTVTGYQYEPWHFRYVGTAAALAMRQAGDTTLETFLAPKAVADAHGLTKPSF
jgi:LAS superfamily LD-carboxypeptidase LdcB